MQVALKSNDDESLLKTAFLNCIDTNGIHSDHVPMGGLGSYYYDGRGAELWNSVAQDPTYYVSRDSLVLAKKTAPTIFSELPENSDIYMLGTSNDEALCFAQAAMPFHQVRIVDVSPVFADAQCQYLRSRLKGRVSAHCLNYQERNLPRSDADFRIIVWPSANIGNSTALWQQDITDNQEIIHRLAQFRRSADALVIGYDTNQNEESLKEAYGSRAHDNFVLSVFDQLNQRLNLKGLDVSHLRRVPEWQPQNSALLHTVVSRKRQNVIMDHEEIIIEKDQPLYPGLSQKFGWATSEQRAVESLAAKAGWQPQSKIYQLGFDRMALQVFV